jgi:WD40 repeat protein
MPPERPSLESRLRDALHETARQHPLRSDFAATVAAGLLDRRGSRLAGWLRFALPSVVALAAIVVLVGYALVSSLNQGPLSGSTAPSPSPSPSASEAPSASGAPGTLVPLHGWAEQVIDHSSQGINVIGWSPDGSKFAATGGHDVSTQTVQVFDRDGTLLRTFPGQIAGWVDADHLAAVIPAVTNPAGDILQPAQVWLRSATSADDRQLDVGGSQALVPLGGGTALAGRVGTGSADKPPSQVFRVLHDGTLSNPLAGYPLAWSDDGRTLAYVTDLRGSGRTNRGSLRILDLTTMTSHPLPWDADTPGIGWLSADGSVLMACIAPQGSTDACGLAVLDTASGEVRSRSSVEYASRAAVTTSYAVVFSPGDQLYVWPAGSTAIPTRWQPPTGTGIEEIKSSGGWTLVFIANGPADPQVIAGSPGMAVVSIGPYYPHLLADASMAADGSRVVFTRRTADGTTDELVLGVLPVAASPSPRRH